MRAADFLIEQVMSCLATQCATECAKSLDGGADHTKTLHAAQTTIMDNFFWAHLADDNIACECKLAITCLGTTLSVLVDGTINDILSDAPVAADKLTWVTNLNDFADLRPYIDRQESLGKIELVQQFKSLQSSFRSIWQPKVAAALDAHAAWPIKKLKVHWATAQASLRVLEKLPVTGSSASPEEVDQALEDGTNLDNAAVDLQALVAVGSNKLHTQRCQVLKRVFSAIVSIGSNWPIVKEKPMDPNRVMAALIKLYEECALMETWVQGNKSSFTDIDKGWFASALECERALKLLQELVKWGEATYCCFRFCPL